MGGGAIISCTSTVPGVLVIIWHTSSTLYAHCLFCCVRSVGGRPFHIHRHWLESQSSYGIPYQHCMLTACSAVSGLWVGDCFIYNNSAWRLNYCVGGEVTTMYHLDRPMYLLGYLASHSKVYLIDKVSSASLLLQHYFLDDAHAQLHHSLG